LRHIAPTAAIVAMLSLSRPAAADDFTVALPMLPTAPSMTGTIDESWSKAARVPVTFDFTYQRPGEPATVYVAQDPGGIDAAFVVSQKEQLTAAQETNGAGVPNDDHVTVALWPQGSDGFAYTFSATPVGARYQTSSENSAYSPEWTAAARRTPAGYTVTIRIPFAVIRSGGSTDWKVQFERSTIAKGSVQVWEHAQGQRNAAEAVFAGTLRGVRGATAAAHAKPKPRLQVYGLGEIASGTVGGDTSRTGADLALPVSATSSLLASFHPDYSNLEIDQQSIAPTAFARRYSEVRPFFTQAASNFNYTFSCTNCPTTLYTPAIPTFRQGYAT